MTRQPLMATLFAITLILAALPGPLRAQEGSPAKAFQGTIQSQLDAFAKDDFATAFGYAAPFIQDIFRTPDNFGQMVRNGYPMVWRPGEVEFLDVHPREGGVWQKVMITDRQGRPHLLDYQMVTTPDGLRIGGVDVLKMPDVGV